MKTNKNAAVLAKSTALEKGLYGLGQIGMNLCWTFMMMYVTMYYTDSVGISAAVVGTVMLVARLFDGAADVLCSMMFKRTHMKLGKIRPWFMIAAPLLGISLIMSFNVPADWSVSAKGIYVFVTYTFTAAVSYTIVSLAFASFLPLLSYDPIDRTKVSSVGMLMTNSGVVVMNYITPILLALNGGIQAPGAWRTVSLIYAVLSTVFVFCLGLFTREKEVPEAESEKGQAASGGPSFSKLLKIVLRTRYTWILVAIFTMFYLYNGVHGIVPFFFRDVMGNINLYGTSSLINMAAPLIGITVSPRLFAKFGRKKIIINGMIFYVIFNVIIFLFHNIAYVFWPCQILRGLSQSPMITAIFVFVADLVDHIRKKYHVRVEEIASMTSSIGTKVGSGLGTAMVGWSLGIFKYDPASKIQSEVTQNGIVFTMAVVPAIVATLVIVAMHFWDI